MMGPKIFPHTSAQTKVNIDESTSDDNIIVIEAQQRPVLGTSTTNPALRRVSSQPTTQLNRAIIAGSKERLHKRRYLEQGKCISYTNFSVPGGLDPFGVLPGGLHDETLLVHHYNTQFLNTLVAPGPRKDWFPISLNDEAMYHSILMIAAEDFSGLQNKPPPPSFWYHRGEAIRRTNARLKNIDLASTDYSIATIAILGIADCMQLDKIGVRAHKAAFERLISARGGLGEISLIIQKLLGWIDLLSSMVLSEPPVLSPSSFMNKRHHTFYGLPSESTNLYGINLATRLLHFTNQPESCELAARIYWGLRNVFILRATARLTETNDSRDIHFSDRCEFLEREVQKLLHTSRQDPIKEPNHHGLIFILFARGSLLYIYAELRGLLMNVKLFEEAADILEESMDVGDRDLNLLLGTFPDLMLWIVFLGGSVAHESRKVWFAKTAAKILRLGKVEDDKIMDAANFFLWPEGRENYDDSPPDPENTNLHLTDFKLSEILR